MPLLLALRFWEQTLTALVTSIRIFGRRVFISGTPVRRIALVTNRSMRMALGGIVSQPAVIQRITYERRFVSATAIRGVGLLTNRFARKAASGLVTTVSRSISATPLRSLGLRVNRTTPTVIGGTVTQAAVIRQ